LHSVLAAGSVKDRLAFGRYHRLVYNGFALVHLCIVWWLGRIWLSTAPPLDVLPIAALIGDGATLLGLGIIAVALMGYDRGRFLRTMQIRSPGDEPDEDLKTGGLLRYVRHPLDSGLFWCFGAMHRLNLRWQLPCGAVSIC
jgi:protein-S-isoprenylcysteine O-methyltransferase Ste14